MQSKPMIRYNATEFERSIAFEAAVKVVLEHEGGYANDADDTGGITKYGITLHFLKGFNIDLNGDGIIDKHDIIDMTVEQAKWVYRKFIWELHHYDRFAHQGTATKMFDMSVNMGEAQANKLLQRAINLLKEPDIVVDGVRGEMTILAANAFDGAQLLHELKLQVMIFYKALVDKRPVNKKFLKGWLKRASA